MISCTRRLQFCAGHRVAGHENKCAHLHGHNYVVLVTAVGVADPLDAIGRVIDFSVLKDVIGSWIDRNLDHGFLVWAGDEEACAALATLPRQKVFVMNANPTAENIARLIANRCDQMLPPTVCAVRVDVEETENCSATAQRKQRQDGSWGAWS